MDAEGAGSEFYEWRAKVWVAENFLPFFLLDGVVPAHLFFAANLHEAEPAQNPFRLFNFFKGTGNKYR